MDFGSKFTASIEKILERNDIAYKKVMHDFSYDELGNDIKGIIITGSMDSVFDNGRRCNSRFIKNRIPKLAICYGHQLTNDELGGEVIRSDHPEMNKQKLFTIDKDNELFDGFSKTHNVAMFHNDEVTVMGKGFICLGHTEECENAAGYNEEYRIYSLQYHPESDVYNDYSDEYFINFNKICNKNGD